MKIPDWLRTTGAVLLLAAVVAATAHRTWENRVVPGEPDPLRNFGFMDFREGVYFPTLAFVSGDVPYDAETYRRKYPVTENAPLYSPLMYLMHAPLAFLSFDAAAALYLILCFALMIGLSALVLQLCGAPPTVARVAVVATLLIVSRPGVMHLALVNVTTITVLLTYLAFWYSASRPMLSATALAVSTFKGTYGLPIAFLLGLRDDRRVVVVGLLLAALFTAPAVVRLTVGAGGIGAIVETLRDTYDARLQVSTKRPENSPYRIDAVAFTARMLGRSPTTVETLGLIATILGAAAAALRKLRPSEDRAHRLHATCIASFAVVAAFYHQAYDALALMLPLVALAVRPDLEPWRGRPALRLVALALVAVPFVNYLATESAMVRFGEPIVLAASSLNGFAILGALAVYVVLAWRVP